MSQWLKKIGFLMIGVSALLLLTGTYGLFSGVPFMRDTIYRIE